MKSNAIPFWESNLNPITMFSPSISQSKQSYKYTKRKGCFLKKEELINYTSAFSLRKKYSVSSNKLKDLFESFGTIPKYHLGVIYYNNENVDKVIEILLETKKDTIDVDMSIYISNKELINMFGFNTNKAHYVAASENLIKKRFAKNVNYYEREKAIVAFTKHNR